MKKFMKSIQMMAALLLAVAATTACSKDDNAIDETTPATTGAPKTYTLTVTASKGGEATTRALSIDDDTGALNATWTEDDEVTVQEYWEDDGTGASPAVLTTYGTLTATNVSPDGYSCTLTGEITGDFSNVKQLTLIYNGGSAGSDGTKGTLNYVAKNDDRATAVVSITGVSDIGGADQTLKTTPATFENQQAILRFTLKDGAKLISPTALNVKRKGGGARTLKDIPAGTYDDNGEGVLYMAFPGCSGTIMLDATLADGSHRYYQKKNVTLENGKYYTIDVMMKKGDVDLSALTADYTAKNGDILYGTLPQDIRLSIASNAEVTLNAVTTQKNTTADPYPGIECKGSATINLAGTNQVVGNYSSAGISVPEGETLTIQGDGSLTAQGGQSAAGIGSGKNGSCGNIIISGGTVSATGDGSAAGIGSGDYSSCGNITIKGGTVSATSSSKGAGIGSGSGSRSSCGNITISGGTVSATSGENGAGIGSGYNGGSCGKITISGGTVTATGVLTGAGIGSSFKSKCGSITITDKVTSVTAVKGKDASHSIGQGKSGTCGKVTIGGTVYYDGAEFQNNGGTYLAKSPLVYEPKKQTESNQQ